MALDDFARRVGELHDRANERSQTARLNAYFPIIEQALYNGLSLASILRELQAEGFTFRITGLKSALYRIRKKRTATAATGSAPGIPPSHAIDTPATDDNARSPVNVPAQTTDGGQTRKGWKTIEQLRAENPTMPKIQLNKLYAQQYDQPKVTSADLEELKRRYPPKPKA
ncbi:hypothetical protein AWB68_06583 [Caballeronia choica]|uniref:Uncharacterized protein n=1 Tax=Caballeronia choica TaxID=326476 RepID=A0A158KPE7_9BURK|nr:hypothetical protein [Caballeronia choica]SAL82603.1 hypothetical protein AWB68_06583 [Caballeronia choica]